MKYYKIVDPSGHNGLKYYAGYNEDPLPFNPSGSCEPGGIYFAKEDILAFLWAGTELYEVEPVGPVYENPGKPKKYKAHAVYLRYIGRVQDNIEFLIKRGADVQVNNDFPLRYFVNLGALQTVKILIKHGANIHACEDVALRKAVGRGDFDMAKFLVKKGADIHVYQDNPIRLAVKNEYYKIIKYLLQHGADIHANNDEAIKLAEVSGNKKIANLIKQYC